MPPITNDKDKLNVRLHFKEVVSDEMVDATWQEIFDLLGIFENTTASNDGQL